MVDQTVTMERVTVWKYQENKKSYRGKTTVISDNNLEKFISLVFIRRRKFFELVKVSVSTIFLLKR